MDVADNVSVTFTVRSTSAGGRRVTPSKCYWMCGPDFEPILSGKAVVKYLKSLLINFLTFIICHILFLVLMILFLHVKIPVAFISN